MPIPDHLLKELMATFQAEVAEHIDALNKGLLSIEQTPPSEKRTELLTTIFRAAHSIKGASRAVNMKDIEIIAHRIEDALAEIREGRFSLTSLHINALLAGVDAIGTVIATFQRGDKLPEDFVKTSVAQLEAALKGETEPVASPPVVSLPPANLPEENKSPQTESPPPLSPSALVSMDSTPSSVTPHASGTPGTIKDQQAVGPRPMQIEDTIRVRTTKLDALMDSLGELLVMQMRTEKLVGQVKGLQERALRWQKRWQKTRPHTNRLKRYYQKGDQAEFSPLFDFLDNNEQELKALSTDVNSLLDRLSNDRNHLQLVTDDLQNGIRSARMLPIATLFDLFPRMVRDLSQEVGKEIVLKLEGQDTEVDRQALELMKDPLTHLLRNAIDHGIEPPEERLASGKPRQGIIRLSAEQRGSNLVLMIVDDGRGINLEAIRRSAVEKNLVPADKIGDLTEREVVELIFYSGLSTAKKVSDLSGRGVGMDVVHRNIEQMRGMIQVETTLGMGTIFTLILPLTLATSQVLLVRVAGETIGLPMMNVERILHVHVGKIGNLEGHPAIYAEGRPLPLVSLAHILRLPEVEQPLPPDAKIPAIILSIVEKRIAVRVSSFLTTQQVVIKSLGGQLHGVRNITGAAILGDGQLVTILNVSSLMKSIHGKYAGSTAPPIVTKEVRRWRVLLVDDSITTRALEKHILENAGYEVISAADGQEAWDLICSNEQGAPDLVVSDINMPRMDGIALTQSIKGDSKHTRLPVVLVTSLDSPQDRLHGMEAGADAYIVKGTFDQRELLTAIERLIK